MSGIDTSMKTFHDYLWIRMPIRQLVREVTELFPKASVNALFQREIDSLLDTVEDDAARKDLIAFRQMDQVGYIDRSLRRAGFGEAELDALVHDVAVKLLLGSFFRKWSGQPLLGRFKVAVKNAITTMAVKASKHRKRSNELPAEIPGRQSPGDDMIQDFRNWLEFRYGELAVRVLDHRLAGDDVKELIGRPGLETSYRLKQAVQQIKTAAKVWAARDPVFLSKVEKLLADAQKTLEKRFRRESPSDQAQLN
jgi:hypothetical protein